MRVATGVVASTAPASNPAAGPNQRRTVRYSRPTAATPSSVCGARMLHEFTPKIRAVTTAGQRLAGVLSTVMKFDASDEP